jgi:hypothetical protein
VLTGQTTFCLLEEADAETGNSIYTLQDAGYVTIEEFTSLADMESTTGITWGGQEDFTGDFPYSAENATGFIVDNIYNWKNIDVQPAGDSLPSQTGNAGKFLTTDGTNASWGDALINNSPTNDKLVIGDGATVIDPSIQSTVVVGAHATGNDHYATVIGTRSSAVYMGTSIGSGARSSFGSIAIGSSATASASHCMQISISGATGISKTNSDANTVKISNENGNFEIMSADGTIPEARLADTTSATSGQVLQLDSNNNAVWKNIISTPSIIPTLLSNSWTEDPTTHEITQTVSVVGVTLTNLVMVGPTPVSAEDYNDSDVICIAQGVDTLTFKCATIPSVDLTLNVLCF